MWYATTAAATCTLSDGPLPYIGMNIVPSHRRSVFGHTPLPSLPSTRHTLSGYGYSVYNSRAVRNPERGEILPAALQPGSRLFDAIHVTPRDAPLAAARRQTDAW